MTRQEFISKLALLDDNEFDNLVLIYKDGGKKEIREPKEEIGASDFEDFLKTLPENLRKFDENYQMKRYWELFDKPHNFDEALEKGMFTLENDGFYHARSVALNKETGEYEFMKHSQHPTYYMETDWYNSDDPEAVEFRKEYELLENPFGYSKYVKRHLEGGPIDSSTETSTEATPLYDLTKLFNAINAVTGGDPKKRKYSNLETFNLIYQLVIKPVYNYLRSKGWTSELVSGVLGNIMQESAFNHALRGGLTLLRGAHLKNYANTVAEDTWQNHLNYIDDWKNGKLLQDKTVNYNYRNSKYNSADHSTASNSAKAFYNYWEAPGTGDTTLKKRLAWADIFYRWFNNPVLFKKDGGSILYKLIGGNLNNQQSFGDWLLEINKDWFNAWDNFEYDNDPALESFLGTLQTKYELNPNSVQGLPKDYSNAFSANLIPFTEGTAYNTITPELWQSIYNHYKKGYEDFYKDPQNKYKSYLNRETYNREGGKLVTIHKNGGSILDLLKELLGDSEIIDLLQHFGIDELMEGGMKNTKNMSIQIVIEGNQEEDCKGHKTPELKKIEIGDNEYEVEVVTSEEDMEKGLGFRESLSPGKGMLFDFGEVQDEVTFNMENCHFPLDIIFIDDEDEVIRVAKGCPDSLDLFTEKNVRYVLEVNPDSGITKGDELDVEPEDKNNSTTMKVLAPDGSTLMDLEGGERIFSRKNTRDLIKWAKRANKSKANKDYKHLGNIMFKFIQTQDTNKPEYVEVPDENN